MSKYFDMQKEIKLNRIEEAAEIIKKGGIVLFPTETVYGIGANAFEDSAVKKIFIAKGREQDNPLILHIADISMVNNIVENISEIEYKLMDAFWPGPFTIVFDKKKDVANEATCGGNTVGIRMPNNKIAYHLIKKSGVPIAAPSANISGRPSGTKVDDIREELEKKVDCIIDGGECEIGIESTVVRVVNGEVKILRPGKVSKEDIELVVNSVEIDEHISKKIDLNEKVLSPGMKYRHYAPSTPCKLIYSDSNLKLVNRMKVVSKKYKKPLILSTTENLGEFAGYQTIDIGSKLNLKEICHNIFSNLRKIDEHDADIAIIEGVKTSGIGLAVMNRLIRAAEYEYEYI